MALTVISIPQDRVRHLRVVHAIDINKELPKLPHPSTTIRIRRKKTKIVRVASVVSAARRFMAGKASSSSALLSGVAATGQEAAFPSSTYLRKRYKKLQKCQISHPTNFRNLEGFSIPPPPHDPSFDAIRALNRHPDAMPEPQVVHATVKDPRSVTAETLPSIPVQNATATPLQCFASSTHESRSFSSRLDKLVTAVEAGQHIRFAPSDRNGNVEVFTSGPAAAPGIGAESWVTEQNLTQSHDFQSVAYRRPKSTCPMLPVSSGSDVCEIVASQEVPQPQQLSNPTPNVVTRSSIVNQDSFAETAVRHKHHAPVDPRVLYIQGRDGVERRKISPIPLNYQRPRGLATPSVHDSESRSDISSPPGQVLVRQAMKERRPANPTPAGLSAIATTGGNPWYPELAPTGPRSLADRQNHAMKRQNNAVEEQDKPSMIGRWLRNVKEALGPAKKSRTQKTGRSIGVFQDNPSSNTVNQAIMPIARTSDVLRDRSNVQQIGYPVRYNYLQQQAKAKTGTQGQLKQQPAKQSVYPLAPPGVTVNEPQTELHPRPPRRDAVTIPDRVSSLKVDQGRRELNPDADHALARLEGRVAPPVSSPIRRCRDDADTYNEDGEVEIGRLRIDTPQPLPTYRPGAWTTRFDEAVDAGFDCAFEAPTTGIFRRK
ncbi:MAG: hypothetical protein L6R35_001828 [Caloplaca aegaea]|nr:MAG: hypothetical protein L6R35_001828 [Caloplaca aegaea]